MTSNKEIEEKVEEVLPQRTGRSFNGSVFDKGAINGISECRERIKQAILDGKLLLPSNEDKEIARLKKLEENVLKLTKQFLKIAKEALERKQ